MKSVCKYPTLSVHGERVFREDGHSSITRLEKSSPSSSSNR